MVGFAEIIEDDILLETPFTKISSNVYGSPLFKFCDENNNNNNNKGQKGGGVGWVMTVIFKP